MQVAAGSATNLKPGLVMQTLFAVRNLEENDYAWLVTRCDIMRTKAMSRQADNWFLWRILQNK